MKCDIAKSLFSGHILQMVAESTDKTQLLDTSDDFPTLALEVTPEVVRNTKKITEGKTQSLPDSDAATQVKKSEKCQLCLLTFLIKRHSRVLMVTLVV